MFGTPTTTPAFGTPSTPAFGTPSSTPGFGAPASSPLFGTPPSTFSAFGSSSTPAFGATSTGGFGSLFPSPSPFSQQPLQQQQTPGQSPSPSPFGLQPFATPAPAGGIPASPFGSAFPAANTQQLMTQMAPVAPLHVPLVDRDVTAIVDAYKDDPGNPKYAFRHLLFSVTDSAARVKPLGVSDIMWAEAMAALEGMESSQREKLWPQLVQGFKDLSVRLKLRSALVQESTFDLTGRLHRRQSTFSTNVKLQDEVLVSDTERLRTTQTNVKVLQRHHQADTVPWIQRLRQQEQSLQRRLLRVMRIIETLESRGLRIPYNKAEGNMAEKLGAIAKQLKAPSTGLSPRVHNLLSLSRLRANAGVTGSSVSLPGSAKLYEQGLSDLQDVLQQQNEAISRLGNVLKRDIRDMEIIQSEDTDMLKD